MASDKKELEGAFSPKEYREFELKSVDKYNHNSAVFTFKLPEGTASKLPVASCIMLKPADSADLKDEKGNPIARPYTPVSHSDKEGEVVFVIKKYDTGKVTPHLHSMKPGDKVSIQGPFPKHQYKGNEFEKATLIAGGSGITPMYQLLQHALEVPGDKTKFTLIYSNVSEADILLREEFDKWAKQHADRLEVVYVLDKADANWKGPTGYITKELIQQHTLPPTEGSKVKVFVCGPPGQMKAISGDKDGKKQGELGGVLKELGYTSEQVFKF